MSNLLAGEPQYAAPAWNSLASTIQAEGGDLYAASSNFVQAWNTLQPQGLSAKQIANCVSSLVINNSTATGIVTAMEGVVDGALTGNIPEIAQSIGGTLTAAVGAGVAAGSISFGVGAVIVAGITLVEIAFSQGLFGTSKPTATICGANISGPAPTYAVGCVWTSGSPDKRGPGATLQDGSGSVNGDWRRFPEPTNPNDTWWFTPIAVSAWAAFIGQPIPPQSQWPSILSGYYAQFSSTQWTSSASGPKDSWNAVGPNGTLRPIDLAWPQYHQLECDLAAASPVAALGEAGGTTQGQTYTSDDVVLAKFTMAYFGAWKVNQEYALNGIPSKAADDGDVLVHIVNLWSVARKPGATRTLTARNSSDSSYQTDVIQYPQPCAGSFSTEWWYIEMLLPAIGDGAIGTHVQLYATNSFQTANQPYALTVNTGALTAQAAPGTIVQGVAGSGQLIVGGNMGTGGVYTPGLPVKAAGVNKSSSSGAGTALLVLGGLAALGAGGTYLYGRHHGMTFGQTVRSGWDRIRHPRGGGSRHLPARKARNRS
jgi:hypothetical protein